MWIVHLFLPVWKLTKLGRKACHGNGKAWARSQSQCSKHRRQSGVGSNRQALLLGMVGFPSKMAAKVAIAFVGWKAERSCHFWSVPVNTGQGAVLEMRLSRHLKWWKSKWATSSKHRWIYSSLHKCRLDGRFWDSRLGGLEQSEFINSSPSLAEASDQGLNSFRHGIVTSSQIQSNYRRL